MIPYAGPVLPRPSLVCDGLGGDVRGPPRISEDDSDYSMDGTRDSGLSDISGVGPTARPSRASAKGAIGDNSVERRFSIDEERLGSGGPTWSAEFTDAQRHRLQVAVSGGECSKPVEEYMKEWGERVHQKGGHLVFLSARPESYKGFTEAQSFNSIFKPLLQRGEMHGYPLLLLGSLRAGPLALTDYLLGRDLRPLQRQTTRSLNSTLYIQLYRKKLSRFKQYAALYPECCWIFVGDNGQGDVMLAESIWQQLRQDKHDTRLLACFIHKVGPVMQTLTSLQTPRANKAAWLAQWRDKGIYFQSTFVGMAVQAHVLGLIDEMGLHHVVLDAVWTLRYMRTRYAFDDIQWDKVVSQTNKDIQVANEYLADDLQVSLIRQELGPSHAKESSLERTSTLRERHSHVDPAEVEASMT
eukprot:jgi/Botrbrau1/1842/Bobra.146_1s0036.1